MLSLFFVILLFAWPVIAWKLNRRRMKPLSSEIVSICMLLVAAGIFYAMYHVIFLEFQPALTEINLRNDGGGDVGEFSASGRATRALRGWIEFLIAPLAFFWYLLVYFVEFGKNKALRNSVPDAAETTLCGECYQPVAELRGSAELAWKCPHCGGETTVVTRTRESESEVHGNPNA